MNICKRFCLSYWHSCILGEENAKSSIWRWGWNRPDMNMIIRHSAVVYHTDIFTKHHWRQKNYGTHLSYICLAGGQFYGGRVGRPPCHDDHLQKNVWISFLSSHHQAEQLLQLPKLFLVKGNQYFALHGFDYKYCICPIEEPFHPAWCLSIF